MLMQEEVDSERVELGQEAHEVLRLRPRRSTDHAAIRSNCRRLASLQRHRTQDGPSSALPRSPHGLCRPLLRSTPCDPQWPVARAPGSPWSDDPLRRGSILRHEGERWIFESWPKGSALFLVAADATYAEDNLRNELVDGITYDPELSLRTLRALKSFASEEPTIVLPSHDPDGPVRLMNRRTF